MLRSRPCRGTPNLDVEHAAGLGRRNARRRGWTARFDGGGADRRVPRIQRIRVGTGAPITSAVHSEPTPLAGPVLAKKFVAMPLPRPEPPAPALTSLLHSDSGLVLEAVHYRVDPASREAFLTAMREVRHVRLRAGALVWRLYEDVARPDRWTELWTMESWTDHLREAHRLDEADRAALARAVAMHQGDEPPQIARHLNVDP